jgi:hypothetical protein
MDPIICPELLKEVRLLIEAFISGSKHTRESPYADLPAPLGFVAKSSVGLSFFFVTFLL